MTKTTYDPCLCHSSDKLGTTALLYQTKALFNPSPAAQIVELLPDNIALSSKIIQWQINIKSRGLRYVKFGQDIFCVREAKLYLMAHRFDIIEKRHWGRYRIVRAKSHQHKHYGMGGTGKHEIGEYKRGKDGTREHKRLAIFIKSC